MKRFFLIVMLVCLNSAPGLVQAKQLPLWEAGIGGTALLMPDYRGSDEYRGYLLPFPW
ncbi:MAG: hypothetical protein ABSE95_05365 [Thermodesulfobacteriota bacterium]|jgi:outer membrane scaffolding protein for murein synthesis (MipA/OmpV family)